ncbi:MAG: hypothetical protein IJV69_05645 [Kiritimatiellae bacterium]|nr:hypothetical protein [Kiritimatiellia bacterium]
MVQQQILIGNSFPLSLIRREVKIEVCDLEVFKVLCRQAQIHSFWGHENTRAVAEEMLGVCVKPGEDRPAVALTEAGLPTLNGAIFTECYILSPNYKENVRPKIGEEVAAEQIASWHLLRISWIDGKEVA